MRIRLNYLAARFGIRSIPTLVIFRSGNEAARISGALDAGRFGPGAVPSLN